MLKDENDVNTLFRMETLAILLLKRIGDNKCV
ncbi:hypothetical protein P799_16075 [Lysinibacillus sphaericus CBAM5]|uniref:Uncharacterized protein n=1 Tax=Lysinibacillus sphaericus CBAM5 TaxID=1400869 RepID=W7RXZ1_LYSSH|nr:hypothetical protein P799_16075 [Lysinibacillus sphaericus CBAM5]